MPKITWVPQSFAQFANDWALDCGKTVDRTALDSQRPLLKLYTNRSRLSALRSERDSDPDATRL